MIDIQKIAREAGYPEAILEFAPKALERFATLYREALIKKLVAGSGEPHRFASERSGMHVFTRDQLAGAVARERERCAQAAEKQARWIGYNAHAEAIAAAIREQT